ncbi:MAG TPA: peptide chain release factor N(5)-glutamine methyltransferase [Burkholderiales bacterium]|nr:peptide chain release factor N(5)-glutamine methyltransferase [Burkholderiales bacterium]
MTVAQALAAAGIDSREARLLLAEASGFSEASVIAAASAELPFEVESAFLEMARRRREGEPVAYILGRKEFYGIELAVNPAVLIPRPETELLVELALQREVASVLDLGTGSGAVALALKCRKRSLTVVAVDSDLAALAMARRNAGRLNLDVDFRHGRWFGPVAGERFDLVVANPPYVAAGDPHLAELRFEPRNALVAGADGLEALREIATQVGSFLRPGGWVLLEHGLGQERAVRDLLAGAGLEAVTTWPDLAGIARVSGAKLKS